MIPVKNGPSHFAKSAGSRLQLSTDAPYVCGFAWSDMARGCVVYTERAETAAISRGTSHVTTKQRYKYITSLDIQKRAIKT